MFVVLKENLFNIDFERILNIVRKYDIELPKTISYKDLEKLQQDKAVENILTAHR